MADLPIPAEALEDCGAILGRRGAGKSGTGRLLLEHELDAGHRCVVIDPKGDWWGARMDAKGKPSGYDLPIFGGEHGDLELREGMAADLGRIIATHDVSCIVDLSAFPSIAAMRRFARDFAVALYDHNRQPITLFVDEADQLAPQRVPADMAKLLNAMENLIRLGRQRGIFMWMLTQRPQVLNKNLLSQAESLIAMKMTTPHDRGAVRDWMNAHDPDQAKQVELQLAKLSVGEAFAWVPAADFLERVQFPLFRTFDSGRTPRHGEKIETVALPPIDLSAVSEALASVAEEEGEKFDDTIPADPKKAFEKRGAVGSAIKQREDRIAELEAVNAALNDLVDDLRDQIEELRGVNAECDRYSIGIGEAADILNDLLEGNRSFDAVPKDRPPPPPPPSPSKPPPGPKAAPPGDSDVTGPMQKILDGLGWWLSIGHDAPRVAQLAFASGYSPRSTSFEKARGQLRSAGLVEYPEGGATSLTEAGRAVASVPDTPATRAELHRMVLARLTGPQTAILGALVAAWPEALPTEELAANSGYSDRSTSFEKARGQLRGLGLADYPRPAETRAEDWLFPDRRRR